MMDDDKKILERLRNQDFVRCLEQMNGGPLNNEIYEKYGLSKKVTLSSQNVGMKPVPDTNDSRDTINRDK